MNCPSPVSFSWSAFATVVASAAFVSGCGESAAPSAGGTSGHAQARLASTPEGLDNLHDVDLRIVVNNEEVSAATEEVKLHVSAFRSLVITPGNWETHASCVLTKDPQGSSGCMLEKVDLSDVANVGQLARGDHYRVSLYTKRDFVIDRHFCEDVRLDGSALQVERRFFRRPLVTVRLEGCAFVQP